MARDKTKETLSSEQMDSIAGYAYLKDLESIKAEGFAAYKHASILTYEIVEYEKFYEITVVVQVDKADNSRDAQWTGRNVVRAMHTSLWKETAMSFPRDGVYHVYVRWQIWKNNAAPSEQPTDGKDIPF